MCFELNLKRIVYEYISAQQVGKTVASTSKIPSMMCTGFINKHIGEYEIVHIFKLS